MPHMANLPWMESYMFMQLLLWTFISKHNTNPNFSNNTSKTFMKSFNAKW